MMELKLKKCQKCGALIKVIKDCNCSDHDIMCCGETMEIIKANSTEANALKHIPAYKINNGQLEISVDHVMDDDHYIEWLLYKTKDKNIELLLKPHDEIKMTVPYEKGAHIYSYCNKHGLWECEVE